MACLRGFVENSKKIVGAGLNYTGLLPILKVPKPENPVIFLKPTSSFIVEGTKIEIPKGYEVNEELELGVIIGKRCKGVSEETAMEYVGGYCVALDMTATSELKEARSKGLPWTFGKGFDTACPVSRFISKEEIPDPSALDLWCKVNGSTKQEGNTKDLIFSVAQLISYISQVVTLEPNDLILTGSPPGMGPVYPGDVIEGGIRGVCEIKFNVK